MRFTSSYHEKMLELAERFVHGWPGSRVELRDIHRLPRGSALIP